VTESADFDLAAAGLRADGPGLERWMEVLAAKLQDTLPSHTTVSRRPRRLLSKRKRLLTLEVSLGAVVYGSRRTPAGFETWRERQVGGITIKRERLETAPWVGGLTDELQRAAAHSAEAAGALESLLG